MKTLLRVVLLATAALLLAGRASAQSPLTSSFVVSASVAKNCRIDAVPNIAITTPAAAWDPTSGTLPTPASAPITVRCTKGTSYTIKLNGGVATGVLDHTNGTDTLPFKLYESDCSTAFTGVTVLASSRAAHDTIVCAGLDPAQGALLDAAIAGDYSQTVALEVTF